jgi:hypothetical protein
MQELYLPSRWMRPSAFYRGISTEPRVQRASHLSFAIAFASLCPHQPLSATTVVPSSAATST